MKVIEAFTWGYWGWGTRVAELLTGTDAVEHARGFLPPIFVDIRYKRAVRAPGFREAAFPRIAGAARYRHMPQLGNKNIGSRARAALADPSKAKELLALIFEEAAKNRRVILFCSCKSPDERCHRFLAADALQAEASRAKRRMRIHEWPGIYPKRKVHQVVKADARCADALDRKLKWIPLPASLPLAEVAALPWGAVLRFDRRGFLGFARIGRLSHRGGAWCVEKLEWSNKPDDVTAMADRAHRQRVRLRLDG